jgi:hypothetical protein
MLYHTIQLEPEITAQIEALQDTLNEDLKPVISHVANDAVRTLLDQINERKLEDEQIAFTQLHPQLVETYLGQFVALHEGKLIDADTNERALYIRAHRRYPHTAVGIFPVRETNDEPVHHFIGLRLPYTEQVA